MPLIVNGVKAWRIFLFLALFVFGVMVFNIGIVSSAGTCGLLCLDDGDCGSGSFCSAAGTCVASTLQCTYNGDWGPVFVEQCPPSTIGCLETRDFPNDSPIYSTPPTKLCVPNYCTSDSDCLGYSCIGGACSLVAPSSIVGSSSSTTAISMTSTTTVSAPSIAVSLDKASTHTDDVLICTGVVTSSTSGDFDVIVDVSGGSGTDDPSGVEPCHIPDGQTTCTVNVLIPKEYTKIGDTISCKISSCGSGQKEANAKIVNRKPKMDSVEITPDYFVEYTQGEWVTYSQIFDHNMTCEFEGSDADSEDTTLKYKVEIEIETTGKNGRPLKYKIGGVKTCPNPLVPPPVTTPPTPPCNEWVIPKKDIWPSDKQTCKVNVTDNFGGSDTNQDGNQMPSFDLVPENIDAMNVISGTQLIAAKPFVGRVWPRFTSDLVDELDKGFKTILKAKDTTTGVSSSWTVAKSDMINYPSLGTLKADPYKVFDNGMTAVAMMKDIKKAKDSVNFLDLKLSNAGTYSFSANVDTETKIKESDETNNLLKDALWKDAWKQNKVFRIGVIPVVDPLDVGKFNAVRKVAFDKQVAYMYAGSPLIPAQTQIVYLSPDMVISYNRTKTSHPVSAADYAYIADLKEKIVTNYLDSKRQALGLDLIVGVVIDNNIMKIQGGSDDGVSYSNTWGYWHSILLKPQGRSNTLLHEMSHVFAGIGNGGHVDIAFTEHGWCFDQYSKATICGGTNAPRINIWTELGPLGQHQSSSDLPEHNAVWNTDPSLAVGQRYVNILTNNFFPPSPWTNTDTYKKLSIGLSWYFQTP